MVSVSDALSAIKKEVSLTDIKSCTITDALNHVLAEDVFSPINMPPFNQSAMDGYAVHYQGDNHFEVIGEMKAGDHSEFTLQPGEAVRIFTGGMVPDSANTVIKQEDVVPQGKRFEVTGSIELRQNIRPKGEQITKDELAIAKGTFINAGTVGYLATVGRAKVKVYAKPTISIITTGNELVQPGESLTGGAIYESNSYMLKAALNSLGFEATISSVKDDFDATKTQIATEMQRSDVLILTGGISVGNYDFVGKALNELGVSSIFYKVKQKPGKPLFFGKNEDTTVFALPGNPAAALSCFYVYVTTALYTMIGKQNADLPTMELTLKNGYLKTPTMTHFLKAYREGNTVEILPAQSSAMLNSFVKANCIAIMEEGHDRWEVGDTIKVFLLPV